MITDILKKINHLDWLKFKTWIDFLVNYNLINIYWIWNSVFNKVIQIRDVIFDKEKIFNKDIEVARLEFKKTQITQNISLD